MKEVFAVAYPRLHPGSYVMPYFWGGSFGIGFDRQEGTVDMIDHPEPVTAHPNSSETRERMGSVESDPASWHRLLAAYARPRTLRSFVDLIASVVAYIGMSVGMYFALGVSPLLALALAPVCLLRTCIVFHDCSHGSFLASGRANLLVGTFLRAARALAIRPLAPRPGRSSRHVR